MLTREIDLMQDVQIQKDLKIGLQWHSTESGGRAKGLLSTGDP